MPTSTRVRMAAALSLAIVLTGCASGPAGLPATTPAAPSPSATAPTSALGAPAASASQGTVAGAAGRTPGPGAPGAFSRGVSAPVVPLADPYVIGNPRPTLAELLGDYQYGEPPVPLDPSAPADDWRLARPDLNTVAGYAGAVSVIPGGSIDLHLRGPAGLAQLDVFRVGAGDATHVASLPPITLAWHADTLPDPVTGRVEDHWPVTATLHVPPSWRSGVYLVKVTAVDGSQSYLTFVVRPIAPAPLLVVIPVLSYQAYNGWGGTDLYRWWHGPLPRAVEASFDRPYEHGYGAGMLFRLDFPLIVWLEDHGYRPAYATDIDVARDPALLTGARTVILSGHPEYLLAADRQALAAAENAGVGILGMGANMAYWEVRLTSDRLGVADRTVVCYKGTTGDPGAALGGEQATASFADLPGHLAPAELFGEAYGGVVRGISPLIVGPGMTELAPDAGLRPGEALPGLVGDEVDLASQLPGALLLGATPVEPVGRLPGIAGASAWVTPTGAHVFDAGTFDWSWGLDPRYAAALPGFPAANFGRLMADILAWAGTPLPALRA